MPQGSILSEQAKSELRQTIAEKERAIAKKRIELEQLAVGGGPAPIHDLPGSIPSAKELLHEIFGAGPSASPVDDGLERTARLPARESKRKSTTGSVRLPAMLRRANLVSSELEEHNIMPRTSEIVEKSAQTVGGSEGGLKFSTPEDELSDHRTKANQPSYRRAATLSRSKQRSKLSRAETLCRLDTSPNLLSPEDISDTSPHSPDMRGEGYSGWQPPMELTEEEKEFILHSVEYERSLLKSAKVIERALGAAEVAKLAPDFEREGAHAERSGARDLKLLSNFRDMKWTAERPVKDLQTSKAFPELFLATYGPQEHPNPSDVDGVVLLWNLVLRSQPELAFTSHSPVNTAVFDPFRPCLIAGGTFAGDIVIWDTRAKSRPIQRTPYSSRAHGHPVCHVQVTGSQNASSLVSVDTDGRLCQWSLNMLHAPTETVDLKKGTRDFGVVCACLPEGESNIIWGGEEDGSLFSAQLLGNKSGQLDVIETAHSGPCTSMQWHPRIDGQAYDCTDLLLTTSVDWTSKLWAPKTGNRALKTLEANEDYVLDGAWSPSHPSVFVTGDAEGCIDLWDLTRDEEISVVHEQTNQAAIAKVAFSPDGRRIIAGDLDGGISCWNVASSLAHPRTEDWSNFERLLEQMKGGSI